eukprot:89771_1
MSTHVSVNSFYQLDTAMNSYYISVGRNDYYDKNKNGKLSTYCKSNGIDLDDIVDELKYDPLDCLLVDFDETFPFHSSHSIKTKKDSTLIKYDIIKYCYENGTAPTFSNNNIIKINENESHTTNLFKHPSFFNYDTRKNTNSLIRVDNGLAKYYVQCDRTDYFQDNIGKFCAYCKANGIDSDDIDEELKYDPVDCLLTDFDQDFPIINIENIKSKNDRLLYIFTVLKNCHKFGIANINKKQKEKTMTSLTRIIDDNALFDEIVLKQVIDFESNKDIKCNGKNVATITCHCIKRITLLLIYHHKNINIYNGTKNRINV